MKIPLRTASLIAALLCWILASILTVFIIQGMRHRARLIRDNDNERLYNMLFTSLRDYDDFGSAIEANPVLRERIVGMAVYGNDLRPDYSWGTVPERFDEALLEHAGRNRNGRYTIPDKQRRRIQFVLHTGPMPSLSAPPPPPAGNARRPAEPSDRKPPSYPPRTEALTLQEPPQGAPEEENHHRRMNQQNFWFMNTLMGGKYLYIDIAHSAYWRSETIAAILFPLCEIILLALVLYIRALYLRNREYRDRIEAQKHLVVLGTAASTLAHEIKNPLLSIRLQTGILRKLFPGGGKDEIAIIDEEVDRLSALIYRVNDYLRDAEGHRKALNPAELIAETSQRLCGRNILQEGSPRDALVLMDADRARSVLENLIRNALESGGPEDAVGASILRNNGNLVITVFDRGKGIAPADTGRVFDPFYTSKSTGTGIGLSIVKRFVEAVRGSVRLERREGGGTAAAITLPEI
ncbi:MAG: HAMP domain-containing histidine kinase [Spirochaetaceae bacterium]|jgi:two-component system sensor histidine kinase HydH|nr:HAMP domain-containing histidine kinase [Spirochaetaceae bacterium]